MIRVGRSDSQSMVEGLLSQNTMVASQIVLSFVIFTSNNLFSVQADDVVGCGGFVQSEVDINYSLVQVGSYQTIDLLKLQLL